MTNANELLAQYAVKREGVSHEEIKPNGKEPFYALLATTGIAQLPPDQMDPEKLPQAFAKARVLHEVTTTAIASPEDKITFDTDLGSAPQSLALVFLAHEFNSRFLPKTILKPDPNGDATLTITTSVPTTGLNHDNAPRVFDHEIGVHAFTATSAIPFVNALAKSGTTVDTQPDPRVQKIVDFVHDTVSTKLDGMTLLGIINAKTPTPDTQE